MPTYEYACKSCGSHLDVVQSFSDEALTECPSCGGRLRKVFGNIGITFKGSGFYKTDSRSTSSVTAKGETSDSSSSDSGGSEGGGDGGGEKKDAAAKKEPSGDSSAAGSTATKSDGAKKDGASTPAPAKSA